MIKPILEVTLAAEQRSTFGVTFLFFVRLTSTLASKSCSERTVVSIDLHHSLIMAFIPSTGTLDSYGGGMQEGRLTAVPAKARLISMQAGGRLYITT